MGASHRHQAKNEHLRKALVKSRALRGLTLKELSFKSGINLKQIHKMESGENRIMASKLWALAVAMDMDPGEFFREMT